ncbi:MAG: hypothetical protein AB7V42_14125 [Thermoleophilia bacterium]
MPPIQLPIPLPLINASEFDAHVNDPSGTPTNVIRTEDAWSVDCTWYVQGPIADLLQGRWRLQVGLESIGTGPELVTPAVFRDYQATGTLTGAFPNQRMSFSASVDFAPGTPALGGAPDVAFQATAMLTFLTPAGTPGPFAAVYDLGIIQVFDSPKP